VLVRRHACFLRTCPISSGQGNIRHARVRDHPRCGSASCSSPVERHVDHQRAPGYDVIAAADKAKILNDKKITPHLFDQKNGLALQIPELENVGQLRQVATPENGREYWMAFSNSGRNVKPGDHVTVVIGSFKAEELVVEDSAPRQPH
jgi:hypothetical protein